MCCVPLASERLDQLQAAGRSTAAAAARLVGQVEVAMSSLGVYAAVNKETAEELHHAGAGGLVSGLQPAEAWGSCQCSLHLFTVADEQRMVFNRLWASRGLEMSYNSWQLVLDALQPTVQQDGWDERPSSNMNFRCSGSSTSNLMVLVMMMMLLQS